MAVIGQWHTSSRMATGVTIRKGRWDMWLRQLLLLRPNARAGAGKR